MRLPVIALTALLPCIVTSVALAQSPTPGAALICAECHGTEGRQGGVIPGIASRPAAIIAGKLRDYRADKVADATVMPRLAKGLTDEEIDSVALYFSQLR